MEIKYTLTEEDYIKSNVDYIKFSDSFRKQVNIIKIATAAILLLGSILIIKGGLGFLLGAILAGLELLLFDKYYAFTTSRKVKKAIKSQDLQFYLKGVTLTTNQIGFTIEGKKKKLSYKWSDIKLIGESKERIYLFTESGISEIIPKGEQNETKIRKEIIERILAEGKASIKSI